MGGRLTQCCGIGVMHKAHRHIQGMPSVCAKDPAFDGVCTTAISCWEASISISFVSLTSLHCTLVACPLCAISASDPLLTDCERSYIRSVFMAHAVLDADSAAFPSSFGGCSLRACATGCAPGRACLHMCCSWAMWWHWALCWGHGGQRAAALRSWRWRSPSRAPGYSECALSCLGIHGCICARTCEQMKAHGSMLGSAGQQWCP